MISLPVGLKRRLRRRGPLFTSTVAVALGIGLSSAMLAVCDRLLLRPPVFEDVCWESVSAPRRSPADLTPGTVSTIALPRSPATLTFAVLLVLAICPVAAVVPAVRVRSFPPAVVLRKD